MEAFMVLFFGIGVFALTMYLIRQQKERARKALRTLANRLRLNYEEPPSNFFNSLFKEQYGESIGLYEEQFPMRIWIFSRGSGKSRRTYAAFTLQVNNVQNGTLTLMREDFFRKVGKAIGVQKDIQVRDPEFDGKYIIKSNNDLFAKQLLMDPMVREPFIRSARTFVGSSIKLNGNELKTEIQMTLTPNNLHRLEDAIKMVAKLAQRLENMEDQNYSM